MTRRRAAAVLLCLVAAAGCKPAPEDPAARMLQDLESAHRPTFQCVQAAVKSRSDFAGGLPEMIVEAGMAAEMQSLRKKYLPDGWRDLADEPRTAKVTATRQALLALGGYGGGAADEVETAPLRVRRAMAMVETTAMIAAATGADCEPSEILTSLMIKAENDYL